MRAIFRFTINLVLALCLIVVAAAIVFAGYASVMANQWETVSLDAYADEGEWLWIDERPYYYQTWGPDEGPTVVLIHGGYVEGSRTWEENAWDISRSGVSVVALDLAGLGLSSRDVEQNLSLTGQAQLVAMMLNELRIMDATIVGHDYGAAVALELAQIQPQFVGSLVLISPEIDAEAWPSWRSWSGIPAFDSGLAWGWDCGGPLWERSVTKDFSDPVLAASYVEDQKQFTHVFGTIDALVTMAQTDEQGLRQEWQELQVPTLVVVGDEDPWMDVQEAEQIFAGSDLHVIEGVGHMPHLEASAEVNRLVVQFALER